MAGENTIKDTWSSDYRKWLETHRGIGRRTIPGYVACARTFLVYQEDTEGLDFQSWLHKHKRTPRTVQTTDSAVNHFRLYLKTHEIN